MSTKFQKMLQLKSMDFDELENYLFIHKNNGIQTLTQVKVGDFFKLNHESTVYYCTKAKGKIREYKMIVLNKSNLIKTKKTEGKCNRDYFFIDIEYAPETLGETLKYHTDHLIITSIANNNFVIVR